MNENAQSPLLKYTRQPKLYIDLPSKGIWYPKDSLLKSEELEVYSMTAADEMSIKTPDGLFTGQTVVKLIENCIPAIKNAWIIPTVDLEYILGSIRLATYGGDIQLSSNCKECSNKDDYSVSIQNILDHLQTVEFSPEVKVNDIVIKIRPLTYKEITELQKTTMYVQRAIVTQLNDKENNDKNEDFINSLYDKINTATQDAITNSVIEIVTPEGSETNLSFIKDFLINGTDSSYYTALRKAYEENGIKIRVPKTKVQCSECNHEYEISPQLDYANFFVQR